MKERMSSNVLVIVHVLCVMKAGRAGSIPSHTFYTTALSVIDCAGSGVDLVSAHTSHFSRQQRAPRLYMQILAFADSQGIKSKSKRLVHDGVLYETPVTV